MPHMRPSCRHGTASIAAMPALPSHCASRGNPAMGQPERAASNDSVADRAHALAARAQQQVCVLSEECIPLRFRGVSTEGRVPWLHNGGRQYVYVCVRACVCACVCVCVCVCVCARIGAGCALERSAGPESPVPAAGVHTGTSHRRLLQLQANSSARARWGSCKWHALTLAGGGALIETRQRAPDAKQVGQRPVTARCDEDLLWGQSKVPRLLLLRLLLLLFLSHQLSVTLAA